MVCDFVKYGEKNPNKPETAEVFVSRLEDECT